MRKSTFTIALFAGALLASPARADRAKLLDTYEELSAKLGGETALQAVYVGGRVEQAKLRVQLELLEAGLPSFARKDPELAGKLAEAKKSLIGVQTQIDREFAQLDALDTPLDEAAGQRAYDETYAAYAADLGKSPEEQMDAFFDAPDLDGEIASGAQTIAQLLIEAAR